MKLKVSANLTCVLMAVLLFTPHLDRRARPRGNDKPQVEKSHSTRPVVYLALGDSTGVGIGAHSGSYVA